MPHDFTVIRFTADNVAANMAAVQSSTDGANEADLAVDGRSDTACVTLDSDIHPWWAVDLGAAYYVGHVTVINYWLFGKTVANTQKGVVPPSYGHIKGKGKGKRIEVSSNLASPLREFTCHMGSHSVTYHPAELTFPPLPQPKLVLDLATPEGCKAELTYVM